MNAESQRPIPIDRQQAAKQMAEQRKKAETRYDILYVIGAFLTTAGLGLFRMQFALIAAGAFCLVFPVLNIATGFIRGLRAARR